MGKSRGMGFDDFGRLSDMNDDGVTMSHVDPTITVEGGYQPSVEIDRKFTGRTQLPDGTIVTSDEAIPIRNAARKKAVKEWNDNAAKRVRSLKSNIPADPRKYKDVIADVDKTFKAEMSETMVSRNEWTGDHEASILAPVATLNIGTNFDSQTHREKRPGARDFLVEHGNEAQRQFATGNLREQMHVRSDKDGFADAVNANAGAGISTGNIDVDRKNSFATMENRDATTPSGESIVVAPNPEMVKTQYAKPTKIKPKGK